MWPCSIEICHVRSECTVELSLVEDKKVIQAFPTNALEKPFTWCIRSWCMIGRSEEFDVAGCCHTSQAGAELAIVITDQIRWYLPVGSRFPKLLRGPGVGRGSCSADMHHSSGLEFDDEKSKEHMSSDLLLVRSASVPSDKEVVSGLIQ